MTGDVLEGVGIRPMAYQPDAREYLVFGDGYLTVCRFNPIAAGGVLTRRQRGTVGARAERIFLAVRWRTFVLTLVYHSTSV